MDDTTLPPLADDAACAEAIARMGQLDRDLAVIETAKSEAVEKAATLAEKSASPLLEERAALFERVKAYCEANRARLTDGGRRKTAPFQTGEAAWRLGRQRIEVDTPLKDKIIALFKRRGLLDLIRKSKEDVDVPAVAKALAKDKTVLKGVKGITVHPPVESFFVEPITAELVDRPA